MSNIKYYIVADVHGFFKQMMGALTEKGYDKDNPDHKLIICGDAFDRGFEAKKMYEFLKSLPKDRLIYIRGNHEDLLEILLNETETGIGINDCHYHNKTTDTFEQLAGWVGIDYYLSSKYFYNPMYWNVTSAAQDEKEIKVRDRGIAKVKKIVNWINKHSVDYAEIGNYIFVHGWIPCEEWDKWGGKLSDNPEYFPDWRNAPSQDWRHARWVNGMLAAYRGVIEPDKTIVCGHWNCSYGHKNILHDCDEEYGPDANYDIYKNKGIIALDTCTAYTKKVNVLVLTEEEMYR